MDITQNCDAFAEASGLLKALSVNLIKIANDLRMMNTEFLGEIKLALCKREVPPCPARSILLLPKRLFRRL